MKRFLLLTGVAMATASMMAQGSVKELPANNPAMYLSSNGQYVAATGSVYDVQRGRADEFTSGARYFGVNDGGDACGTVYDLDIPTKESDDTGIESYASRASVWIDGELIDLGYGDVANPATAFVNSAYNGVYALNISNDRKTVFGMVHTGTSYADYPVKWTLNETTGEYDFSPLDVLYSAKYFNLGSYCSANGETLALECKMFGTVNSRGWLIYTDRGENVVRFTAPGISELTVVGISPDGKYILFNGYKGGSVMGLYDVARKLVVWSVDCPEPYDNFMDTGCVSNDGRGFITLLNGHTTVNFYFDEATEALVPESDFYSHFSDIEDLWMLQGVPAGISADGLTVIYNYAVDGMDSVATFLVSLPDEHPVTVNAPESLSLYYTAPGVIKGAWKDSGILPEGASVKGFNVAVDGQEEFIAVENLDKRFDGLYCVSKEVAGNTHSLKVTTVVARGSSEYTSAPASVTCRLSDVTDLYFFENLDDQTDLDNSGNVSYKGNTFFPQAPVGSDYYWALKFNDYQNNSPFWYTYSISETAWESSLLTRFFDASETEDDFYLSFYLRRRGVNNALFNKDNNFIVEYATDGETWTPLIVIDDFMVNAKPERWMNFTADMSELAGKVFQLRFRAKGPGNADCEWRIDDIGIMKNEHLEGPRGLRGSETAPGEVSLEWCNTQGGYQFSYLPNQQNLASDGCQVGREKGLPLITAIELPAEKMKNYIGCEITAVNAMLYDAKELCELEDLTLEGIVFEVDEYGVSKEMSRSAFTEFNHTEFLPSNCVLETPVVIKEGKSYRVGVRLADYPEGVTPIWYQNHTDACKPGLSDLYSEDDGETWLAHSDNFIDASEELAAARGYVVWPFQVTISEQDAEVLPYDSQILSYNVLRDGEVINHSGCFFGQPNFVDKSAPVQQMAKYQVQAFYRDGRVSDLSEPFCITASKVGELASENVLGFQVYPNPATDFVKISGEFDSASLYNMAGMRVLTSSEPVLNVSGLAKGIYLLQVAQADKVSATKLIVK